MGTESAYFLSVNRNKKVKTLIIHIRDGLLLVNYTILSRYSLRNLGAFSCLNLAYKTKISLKVYTDALDNL